MEKPTVTVRPIEVPPGLRVDAARPLLLIEVEGDAGRAWGMALSFADAGTLAQIDRCDLRCAAPLAEELRAIGIAPRQDGRLWLRAIAGSGAEGWLIEGAAAVLLPPDHLEPLIAALTALADALDARLQPRLRRAVERAIRAARAEPWSDDRGWLYRATEPIEACAAWLVPMAEDPRHGSPAAPEQVARLRAAIAAAFLVPDGPSAYRHFDRWRGEDAWHEARLGSLIALLRAVTEEAAGSAPDLDDARPERPHRRSPPPGSRWGHRSGCGPDWIEGPDGRPAEPDTFGFDCGMGHVPALGQRFLAAYVEELQPKAEVLQAAPQK